MFKLFPGVTFSAIYTHNIKYLTVNIIHAMLTAVPCITGSCFTIALTFNNILLSVDCKSYQPLMETACISLLNSIMTMHTTFQEICNFNSLKEHLKTIH